MSGAGEFDRELYLSVAEQCRGAAMTAPDSLANLLEVAAILLGEAVKASPPAFRRWKREGEEPVGVYVRGDMGQEFDARADAFLSQPPDAEADTHYFEADLIRGLHERVRSAGQSGRRGARLLGLAAQIWPFFRRRGA